MNVRFLGLFDFQYDTWTSLVAQTVKHLCTMGESWVRSLGGEDLLEKEMATHSSTERLHFHSQDTWRGLTPVAQQLRICLPCRGHRRHGLIPGWGRSPGEGNGSPLLYSCLENPMDRGAWRVTVQRVAKPWTRLKRPSTHACKVLPGIEEGLPP